MIKRFAWLLLFFMFQGTGFCQTIDWQDYTAGLKKARTEGKKIFLHFKTDWCSACVFMDQQTFGKEEVAAYLNEHFVSIKVDGDKHRSLRKQYKVTGYPTHFFLEQSARQVYQQPGVLPPDVFLFFLKYINSESYKTMTPLEYFKSL